MMRHKDKYSIAVRRPDNEIEVKGRRLQMYFSGKAKDFSKSNYPRNGKLYGFSGNRNEMPDVFSRDCR